MKKIYEKPMLYAESYELVEHVAGGCGVDEMSTATTRDLSQCGFHINGNSAVAFQTESICQGYWNDDFGAPPDQTFCYFAFQDTGLMFAS